MRAMLKFGLIAGYLSTRIETKKVWKCSRNRELQKWYLKQRILKTEIYCLHIDDKPIEGFVRRFAFCTHVSRQKEHFLNYFKYPFQLFAWGQCHTCHRNVYMWTKKILKHGFKKISIFRPKLNINPFTHTFFQKNP